MEFGVGVGAGDWSLGDLSYPNKCRTWCEIFNTKMLKRSLA